jgi:hypothetical protein
MMDINQYLYLPTWEEIEEELEKEVNFMEVFNSDKVIDFRIYLNYENTFVELTPDEVIEVLDDDLIYKILEKSFDNLEIEIILKDDLTELQRDKIYDLRNNVVDLECYQNIIEIYIKYLNKEKVLDFFNELYKILQ